MIKQKGNQENKRIIFISTMDGAPWGGSEELWSRAARCIAARGAHVIASVHGWPVLDPNILSLSEIGVDVRPRYYSQSIIAKLKRHIFRENDLVRFIKRAVGRIRPDLVLISDGGAYPAIEILELCVSMNWPFALVMQANSDQWWPTDASATQFRKLFPLAKRCFFVSKANYALEEKQLGYSLKNAEVIHNPVNLENLAPVRWPSQDPTQSLQMACVGRLALAQKGQDLLIDVLAKPRWRERNWRLALYGTGPNKESIERQIHRANLDDRIVLSGHHRVEQIWQENHLLITPSRYEGLPLVIVEAMFCGRPVVATDVAGNAEVIEDDVTGFLAKTASVGDLDDALERMWQKREHLQDMGRASATQIRKLIPKDPAEVFADKLLSLAN